MPTCVDAATVWRSSTRGWAPVEDATFGDGRVTVKLDHFCDMAVTGQCQLKAVGFILPQGGAAKVALLHVACGTCQKDLEQLCLDPDVLNSFSRCGPSVALGTYHDKEEIQLHQAGQILKMKVKLNRMPLVSAPLLVKSGRHFSVEIDGDDHRFEDPTPSNAATATGLADVQQFAGAATPNLETSQSAAASQACGSMMYRCMMQVMCTSYPNSGHVLQIPELSSAMSIMSDFGEPWDLSPPWTVYSGVSRLRSRLCGPCRRRRPQLHG